MFNKVYSIIFNTNGGKNIEDIKCKAKNEFPELPICEKEGYKFLGWFLDEKFENEMNLEKMPKSDLVLYAKWESISLEEFVKDINFFTKSANILQNLQNDYADVPNFKDGSKKETKTTKKKTAKKVTKKKIIKTTSKKAEETEIEKGLDEQAVLENNEVNE